LSALYTSFISYVCRRPGRALILLVVACVPALALTINFFAHVEAGLQELLPRNAPTVKALEQIHERLGSQSHLTVVVQSAAPETNRRFIAALGKRLAARQVPEARSIQADVKPERAWLKGRAPLLLPADKFDDLMGEVEAAVAASKTDANPLFVSVDEERQSPDERWAQVRQRIERENARYDRFANGFLETADGRTVVMLVWLVGSEVDMGPSTRLLDAVKEEVEALRAQFPIRTGRAIGPVRPVDGDTTLQVEYTGDVPNLIEEHDAILADLSLSSVLVFLLVSLLIIAYFRSARGVLVVLAGVVPGLLFTFALGHVLVGHLNSNTAFLGSIIAGNGINYPLLFLAYYRARPPDEPLPRSLMEAARNALPGTLGAAATASAAYAGLAVSNFRGFSQFGWLGGAGMLVTWALTFVAVPIAILLFSPPRLGEMQSQAASKRRLARFYGSRRVLQIGAGVFVALAALLAVQGVLRGKAGGIYEMHLEALRNRDSLRRGSASWDKRMSELFGSWLNPVVTLVKDPADRESAARELRRTLLGGPQPAVDRIETIETYRPALPEQERRLARLKKVAATLAELPEDAIPAEARPLVKDWLSPARLQPITLAEIPPVLLQGFREVSGDVERAVLIFPSLSVDYADGVNMQMLARRLGEARLPDGAVTGGAFLFMADVFRLVHEEAPRVVLVVCALVALVLIPFFLRQPGRILLVIATVGPVALAAQAIMLAVGVKINMLNFAAVPITIGVGADYVLNLLGAMRSLELGARRACARMGGAILLCSLTTIVGYASLLVAQSGALRTFGWAAVLGEVMAVITVLLVLPSAMADRDPERPPVATDGRAKREESRRRITAGDRPSPEIGP
jgi:predicted RND superfamily exporter protein